LIIQVFDRDIGVKATDDFLGDLTVILSEFDFSDGKVLKLIDRPLQNIEMVGILIHYMIRYSMLICLEFNF